MTAEKHVHSWEPIQAIGGMTWYICSCNKKVAVNSPRDLPITGGSKAATDVRVRRGE